MCAIFGIIGEYNPKILRKMSSLQIARGPDSTGYYFHKNNRISIGMNRLAVIDKKNGIQPMFSYDKKICAIFNGTIFNFKEIKNFLEKKKVNFKTNSDTEVLVNSFAYWNVKCFEYFDGMWATAIYDKEKNYSVLSRDYLGQKPLFYHLNKNKLYFSSQLNGILAASKKKFKLSNKNLRLYYQFSHFPAPLTVYDEIKQVKPGEIITFSNKIKKKVFWDLSKGPNYNFFFKPKKIEDMSYNFDRNLKNYLISDKKSIIALSAGKDSQILFNSVKNILKKKNLSTLTVGFSQDSFDESKLISNNKIHIKRKLTKIKLNKLFHKIKKKLIFFNGDGSIIPTYFLFEEIKKKTNVSLSGDGADEVFFGYITFKAFYIMLQLKKVFPKFILIFLSKIFKFSSFSENYIDNKRKFYLFFKYIHEELSLINSFWINDLSTKEINKITNTRHDHKLIKNLKYYYDKKKNKLRYVQLYYFKYYLPMVLEKVDTASMQNSVENRSPFLNKDLLNFTLSYNVNKNFNFIKSKKTMFRIFKNRIDKKFLNLKKHGFSFQKSIILKNEKLVHSTIKNELLINKEFFYEKYKIYLKNRKYENYLWSEFMLNISLQNLDNKLLIRK